ncbi:IPT/TIG domain-containing protein [Nubsella zeaxanthinifaciens]|uniref:IPT/TIG domain-containing protein n=1 Tax=Nubsella zeaxanthinifaciens TaxID=392412 RepID=UPI003CFE66C0
MRKISLIGLLGVSLAIFATCKKNENGDSQKPTPEPPKPVTPTLSVESFSPASGKAGDTVTVNGLGFGTDNQLVWVDFNGAQVRPHETTNAKLKVIVPAQAKSGKIKVSKDTANVFSANLFTVNEVVSNVPYITTFTPTSAKVGETITIKGKLFGTNINVIGVKFGNSLAVKPTTVVDTAMTVLVPSDAETANISLIINNGTAIVSSETFTVIPQEVIVTLTSFTPLAAKVGETVTIKGTNFGTDINAVTIKIGNSNPIKPTTINATTATIVVPSDATTGKISLIKGGKTIVSNDTFTLTPTLTITNFAPSSAGVGDVVTINGTAFGTEANDVLVYFEGAINRPSVKPFEISPNQMKVVVPNLAITGAIRISMPNVPTVVSTQQFTLIPTLTVSDFKAQANTSSILSARAGEIVDIAVTLTVNDANPHDINLYTVKFNGAVPIKPIAVLKLDEYSVNGKRVRVRIPADAKDGKIEVTKTGYKAGISANNFTISPQMPEPQTAVWTERARLARIVTRGSVAFTIGQKGYIACGETNSEKTSSVWEYDPVYNAWTQKAAFGGGNRAYAVAFSTTTKGYVGTGLSDNDVNTSDLWEYDPTANNWVQKANFPSSARAYAVGFAISNKGYVGSGNSSTTVHYDDFYQYDPTGNAWTKVTSILGSRSEAFAFVVDNKAYVGNGYTGSAKTRMSDMYSYDPSTNQWTAKAAFPTNFNAANSYFTANNKGYVGFGYNSTQAGTITGTNKFYEYSPSLNSWTAISDVPVTRLRATAFSINNVGYVGLGVSFVNEAGSVASDFYAYKPQ